MAEWIQQQRSETHSSEIYELPKLCLWCKVMFKEETWTPFFKSKNLKLKIELSYKERNTLNK